jgi:hypothetical protein
MESEQDIDDDDNLILLYCIHCLNNLWVCMGCEQATLEMQYRQNADDKEPVLINFWPKRTIQLRKPRILSSTPKEINRTYIEVISCFNENNLTLTAMGIRAILEAICKDLNITDTESFGLKGKLAILKSRKLYSDSIINALDQFKFLGDDAAHKLVSPKISEIILALQVLDDLLVHQYEAKYNLENSAKRLHRIKTPNTNQ